MTQTLWHRAARVGLLSAVALLVLAASSFAEAVEVVVVRGTALEEQEPKGEGASVLRHCVLVEDVIRRAGFSTRRITDSDVVEGKLRGCRLAVFPCNTRLAPDEARAIRRCVKTGCRVVFFGPLPDGMEEALSVRRLESLTGSKVSRFKLMRPVGDAIPGTPASVELAPGTIGRVEVQPPAKVVMEWAAEGAEAGPPAVALSPAGCYFSCRLPWKPTAAQVRLVQAVTCSLMPDGWRIASQRLMQDAFSFEQASSLPELLLRIQRLELDGERKKAAEALEAGTRDLERRLQAQIDLGEFVEATARMPELRELAEELYATGFPSRSGEVRAAWLHDPTLSDWDAAMRTLRDAGLNSICVNVCAPSYADYPSKVLPVSPRAEKAGDMVQPMMDAGRRHGVEVHLWITNFYMRRPVKGFMERFRQEGRLALTPDGDINPMPSPCPTHPANIELQKQAMVEMALKYRPASVQYDYIRYMGPHFCFCERCRAKFERDTGIHVEKWPDQVEPPLGRYCKAWNDWRCDQITHVVREVTAAVRKAAPDVPLSADVFPEPVSARWVVAQDWPSWVDSDDVDMLFPMNYTPSNSAMRGVAKVICPLVRGRVPVYMGLGLWRFERPEQACEQIDAARRQGADGFCMFHFQGLTPRVAKLLRLGVTALDAEPDYHSPRLLVDLPKKAATGKLAAGERLTIRARLARRFRRPDTTKSVKARICLVRSADDSGPVLLGELAGDKLPAADSSGGTGVMEGEFTVSVPEGHWRVAAFGTLEDREGHKRSFVARGPVIWAATPEKGEGK